MPMDFPDLNSLERAAKIWKFRYKGPGESLDSYRASLADYVSKKDIIEGHEIRTGKGWDEWTENEKTALLLPNTREINFVVAREKQY